MSRRLAARIVVVVGAPEATVAAGLGAGTTVIREAEPTPARLLAAAAAIRQTRGCVLVAAGAPEPAAAVRAALAAGLPTALSDAAAVSPSALEELVAFAEARGAPFAAGGPGISSLPVATLLSRLRAGELGALQRLVLRSPSGRRLLPPGSRRTPFAGGREASFALDAPALERLVELVAPAVRLAELVAPGAGARLRVSELVGDDGGERLLAVAKVGELFVELELDRELSGEGPWELVASCERGELLVRLAADGGHLFERTAGSPTPVALQAFSPDELLVRHLLAHGAVGIAAAAAATGARSATLKLLEGAAASRASRGAAVVLVHVPRFRNSFDELRLPSLAIARLSGFLRGHGYTVEAVDLAAELEEEPLEIFADDAAVDAWLLGAADPRIEAPLSRLLAALRPAVAPGALVGFSIVDYFGHFQLNLACCLARLVKQETGARTVLGGERDQVDGDRALRPGAGFDFVVEGDGELALLRLVEVASYGDRRAEDVPGVLGRDGSGAIFRNHVARSHLNAMPRPDFDGVPLERYRGLPTARTLAALRADGLLGSAEDEEVAPAGYLPYGFVKGCTAKCTFCSAKENLDVQAPEKSVEELLALSERHGVRDFVFLNNLVNLGPAWLTRFCRLLIDSKAGLQWTDSCRPTGISGELAALMREAGCLLLNFGAESGSDDILRRMKKGLLSADIRRTLRATHAAGIFNRVNLIAGYFHERKEDVELTIGLVEELQEEIDIIGCFQGFYLFEGMGVDAAAEKIVLRPQPDRLRTGQLTLAYDELGGLPWEEKREAIDASRNRILARIEELGIRTLDKINEYDLFFLSRRFDKATVARYLLPVAEVATPHPNRRELPPGGQRGRIPGS